MKKLFSIKGRINRKTYYIVSVLAFLVYYLLVLSVKLSYIDFRFISYLMILNLIVYITFTIRRVHDIGRSGLGIMIPVYNTYIFILALFRKGDSEINKYGEVPLKKSNC